MMSESIWGVLDNEHGEAGQVFRRLHPESSQNLTARLDLTTRRRSLALDLPWSLGDPVPLFTQSRVVGATATTLDDGTQLRVSLELEDNAYFDVFITLTSDVAAFVAESKTHKDALKRFEVRVEQWREMLEGVSDGGLSLLTRRGLFGELHALHQYLIPLHGGRRALEAWTGPYAANQDFQFVGGAVEVKTTTGKQPQALVVANEREFDGTGTGRLFLLHLSLDERRGGTGASLNDAVARVHHLLEEDTVSRSLFAAGLHRVGYLDWQSDLYAEPRYDIRSASLFTVHGNFPRIVEDDLRLGVGAVRYSVSLSACAPYEVNFSDLDTLSARYDGATDVD